MIELLEKVHMTTIKIGESSDIEWLVSMYETLSVNNIFTRLEINTVFRTPILKIPYIEELYIGGRVYDLQYVVVPWCKECTRLKSLHLDKQSYSPFMGQNIFSNYIKLANLKELTVHVADFDLELILDSVYQNTTITNLNLIGNPVYAPIRVLKIPNLLDKTNLVSLKIGENILYEIDRRYKNAFVNNITLEHLTIFGVCNVPNKILYNLSVISCEWEDCMKDFVNYWVGYNKTLRWNMQHPNIINTYLALSSKNNILPPYVFLEIYDRMIDDDTGLLRYNPFVSHKQKIQLMQNLYRSIISLE